MNVNDLVVCGAEPLFFLDYFASGRLDVGIAERVIAGIADGCQQAGCALVGGETAELPGFYADGEYDLAGFCVGVVERSRRIDGRAIEPGDRLLGLASSGFHSNGYSLVRRVLLEKMALRLEDTPPGLDAPLADVLLRPTRIYVRALRRLAAADVLRGAAHITGGGLIDNPPRMIPGDAKLKLQIDVGSWTVPPVFELLARGGGVAPDEMLRTFNMGLGMLVCVPAARVREARTLLEQEGETVFEVGEVAASDRVDAPVELRR
jgi:phosphoribosylformylglycinamidine cyclo-ligase